MIAVAVGLLAALAWGTHDFLVRLIAPDARILPQIGVVMAVAALVILPLGLVFGDWSHLPADGVLIALGSGVGYYFAALALYAAFARAPARLVAPVIGAYPLPALVIGMLRGEAITPANWAASALIVAGVAVVAIFGAGEKDDAAKPHALTFALLACLGFGLSLTIGQEATVRLDPYVAPTLTRLATGATGLLLLAIRPAGLVETLRRWPVLLAMGILDAAALGLVIAAGALPGATFAAVVSSLFGMVTVVLARVFLKERIGPRQAVGIAMVFAGLGWLAA